MSADLTIMGKVLGGGLPAAAYGGRRELMRMVAPAGDVYQAGTLSGNPLAVAAGLATLEQLDADAYERLARADRGARRRPARGGRRASGAGRVGARPGHPVLRAEPPRDFAGAAACDLDAYGASAGRCSTAASIRRPRSSRPGSSRSPTTRRRSSAPARRRARRSPRRSPERPRAALYQALTKAFPARCGALSESFSGPLILGSSNEPNQRRLR